ncbi:MAG TPA: Ppx/GppA phosphatase family protein [Nitrospirota bacterium]|nr:Ppx/GppA phosphatase family protein [Nitrospirota bacterium]
MILAGIDIGTNTLRLLVAEIGPATFQELCSERRITRLGQNLDRTGMLSSEALQRSISALLDFRDCIGRHHVLHTAAIGTSALRKASNTLEFVYDVKKRTGLDIRVITGEEEARLTLLGVSSMLKGVRSTAAADQLGSSLVIDIGGGSTEFIMTRPGEEPEMLSLALGAVYLTERLIVHDPPSHEELELLRRVVRTELSMHDEILGRDPAGILIGTAGTVTTLAAMEQKLTEYDPVKINGFILTREAIAGIVSVLSRSMLEDRKNIRGLEPGREDIILAGAIVAQEIMERYGYPMMVVSDWGLREGILIDLYDKVNRENSA